MKYWSNRKQREKALALLLALTMILTLFPGLGGSVLATDTAVVEAGSATVAYEATGADRMVDIPVNITANPGIAGYTLAITYDNAALTLNSITQGTVVLAPLVKNLASMPAIVTSNGAENNSSLGSLFTLNFTVAEGTGGGDYPIIVSLKDKAGHPGEPDPGNFCNEVPQPVPVTFIAGKITVEGAPAEAGTPIFTTDLSTEPISYTVGDTADALEVSASVNDGGAISYQWYSNSENSSSGGSEISGATTESYIPSTTDPGTTYYYVIATNTLEGSTASATSSIATVTVTAVPSTAAETPVFDINLNTDSVVYIIDASAGALEVSASVSDGGTITYQWYSNSANSAEGGTAISGETAASYIPATASLGITYYYVIATNTLDGSSATVASNVATVTVTDVNTSRTELQTLIYVSKSALGSVEISADGKDIATKKYWVTQAAYTIFSNAIAAAEAMKVSNSVDELILAKTTLWTALNTFNSAKAPGTRSTPGGGTTNTSNLKFDISDGEIAGYVIVSFEDFGDRIDPKSDYGSGLGVIISPVEVPYAAGDSIAAVTIRLLDALGIGYSHWNTTESGFYLALIEDFTLKDGTYVKVLGEFTNGRGSGWMITWNNWFINLGASEFRVEDGDIIKWQYTCQWGADIGSDWDNPSAEITGLTFEENYGTLSPAFSEDVTDYIYTIPPSVKSICLEAKQENYWAILTYKSEGKTYKPMAGIPVKNGTVIRLDCAFSEYYGDPPTDTDYLTITIQVQGEKPVTPGGHRAVLTPKVTASKGVASVAMGASDMTGAIAEAKENSSVAIVIAPEIIGEARKVSVELLKSSVSSMASETEAALTVETPVGNVTVPNQALAAMAKQAAGKSITISLEAVEKQTALTAEQQAAVGDNPVYDISITSGGKNISSFEGDLTVSLPYALEEGQFASAVSVWYLNDAGQLELMSCSYDAGTGQATFTTSHLSYYAVGYDESAVAPVWVNPFIDVKSGDWFYDAVVFVVEQKLFQGTSATTFSPDEPMTRAMLVTVLHRLAGTPAVATANSFTDVQEDQWYTDAVIWANTNGIVNGYGDGRFGINDNITREQMAAILYRYAGKNGYDASASGELDQFSDSGHVSTYALEAMKWATGSNLIGGKEGGVLDSSGNATRAEVATILQRFVQAFV